MKFLIRRATEFLIYFFDLCTKVNLDKSMLEESNRYSRSHRYYRNLRKK